MNFIYGSDMMGWLWSFIFLLVVPWWAADAEEVYSNINGGILRQSPPIVYKGGIMLYPKPDTQLSNVYRDFLTVYTLEGWKTTFTVEKSDMNTKDYVKFTDKTGNEVYRVVDGSQGQVFKSRADVLLVNVFLLYGMVEVNIRVRWISTREDETANWGFLDHATFGEKIHWRQTGVEAILINLVNNGNTNCSVQLGDRVVALEEGEQILSTENLIDGSMIQLVNSSTVSRDFLLEWFPYITGEEGQIMANGFLSYPYTEPTDVVQSWELKTSDVSFPGSSLRISFFNVTTYADDFTLKLLVGSEEYFTARHSIAGNSVYYIPVEGRARVSLTVATSGPFTLVLCYGPSDVTDFKAVGYMRSNGYPHIIHSDHPTKTEGMPLPANWSLAMTLEFLELPEDRAWLDVTLTNKGVEYNTLVQSYTGTSTVKYIPTRSNKLRYPVTQKLWLDYFKYFGLVEGRYPHNEIVARFQSSREATYSRKSYGGYSLRVEAQLQAGDEGVDTVYFIGDSGIIQSSEPYYSGANGVYYDVSVANTSAYNAIEFTFGDSYTEPEKDVLEFFNHENRGRLRSANGFTASGNMTGKVFTYKSTRMTIRFASDHCKEYKGFTIYWKAVYISHLSANASDSNNVTESSEVVIDETEPEEIDYADDEPAAKLQGVMIGVSVALGVVIVLLLILLATALSIIIKDRRKLCDLQRLGPGFYRPKYAHSVSTTGEKLSD